MTKSKSYLKFFSKLFKSRSIRGKEDELERIASQEQKHFRFDTLVTATRNFHTSNKLGEGGFGPVFKGKLDDGRIIAVKKLSKSSRQGKREFLNEAKLLASVQHKNVVNLLGYCVHGEEKLLVYEYVFNQSLDKLLFKSARHDTLDWKRRHDIITGVAKGLLYLHEDAHSCIIHRDIKASNILLDERWAPKIADFGMARLFIEDQTHVNTRVAGTNGYMAPEYVLQGHLSIKADVYSYGVVVLELISGQKNSNFKGDLKSQNLLEWAFNLYIEGKSLEIVDPSLAPTAVPNEVQLCVQIGLLCTQSDPQLRPSMSRVVVMLSKKLGSLEEPTRPDYQGRQQITRRQRNSSSTSGTSSVLNSCTTGSTTGTNTTTASTSRSTAAGQRFAPHGKRPMQH
ncbi:transmembrane signal receptor [Lithospermum erythrorhizon]|uniref:Transmembrane signal receptor n=1 Tax=Lithospermum erythrorhizon TaxID=34254 RepID=A0AAV3QNN5_LITER